MEKARWIKYEENVEPSGNWGRPFLSYVDCESLRQVRRCFGQGIMILNHLTSKQVTADVLLYKN